MAVRFDFATASDIRFGAGRVSEVPQALTDLGVRRVLIVTGRTTSRSDRVRAALADSGIATTVFAAPGEPSIELVRSAVDAVVTSDSDGLLGYGGGSALDVAKATSALAASGSDPLDHLEVIGAGRPFTQSPLPLVAVPTTAGTGSEVTRNAVLSGVGVKASLRSPLLLPRVAVVDPDLLVGLNRQTIASSGMDALSQLIEPYLSLRANPMTDTLAREGIRRSARSLRRACADGLDDADVREDLALASHFGGLCLANAGLGAVHGLASAAGARLGAPHGAVCAAVLAATMDVNLRALQERAPGHPVVSRMGEVATLLTGRPTASQGDAIGWVEELVGVLGIPGFASYGLDEDGIPALVSAARRASSMRANPIELTDGEVTEIVTRSL